MNPKRIIKTLWVKMTIISNRIYNTSDAFALVMLYQTKLKMGEKINAFLVVHFDDDNNFKEAYTFKEKDIIVDKLDYLYSLPYNSNENL